MSAYLEARLGGGLAQPAEIGQLTRITDRLEVGEVGGERRSVGPAASRVHSSLGAIPPTRVLEVAITGFSARS
jgi:hypothetical protein